jgi:hypothetical protein
MAPTTPTNHTSSAFFGIGLELDPTDSSMDEQSSIDCSNLMESSTHTQTSSMLANATGQPPPGHQRERSSTLESVMEETPSVVEPSHYPENLATPANPLGASSVRAITLHHHRHHSTETASADMRTVPSQTLHTSNVDPAKEVLPYTRFGEDSDKIAAWAIHVALIFFCGLIFIALLLAFFVIHQFGLVASIGLFLVVTFSIFLAVFVDKTILSKDSKLKPIRRKILKVVQAAQTAVEDEFQAFQRDWQEHYLLLTNGESIDEHETEEEDEEGQQQAARTKPKKRSALFKMIKPLFGIRKVFRRKRKQKDQATSSDYQPPLAEDAVIA